ncbi:MAG TPA: M13 family metallopeptidase [Gemmatimonadales bacterium]|nr:M13 family metallopeptidase [Gemmatimonadales bacterium]
MRRPLLTPALALAAALAAAPTAVSAQQTKPLDPANMDTTCAACTDFFTYADGGWLKRTEIPGDQPAWGSFNELQENNYAALKGVLTDAAANARTTRDPGLRKLGSFYGACMDSTAIEAAGARPLAAGFRRIAAVHDRRGLEREIARLQRIGVRVAFSFSSGQDAKNSDRVIAQAYQGGLGLPDRDYYTGEDSASRALVAQYQEHITRMFRLLGDDEATAARGARAVLAIETPLARASMTRVERRDPNAIYHLTTASDLARMTPHIAWPAYFSQVGLGAAPAEINVGQPVFLGTLDSLIAHAPLDQWRSYLRWHLLSSRAAALSSPFVAEDFHFRSTVLRGITEMRPRWKRCIAATDGKLGEILGQAYVKKYFTPEAKARALEMVRNIQAEFRNRLDQLTWMTDATKAKAYAKLDAIINKIGYPDHWRDYSTLAVGTDSYAGNLDRADAFEFRRELAKIGKPVDRTEWGMTPPTVNAYYYPPINEVVFPAGIMQPPFFDPNADDAVNYGGMGSVIGHELTHGFDDEGRQYDAQGNLSGWWSDADNDAFNARAQVVRRQFDGYVAVDTIHVNGQLTLGENLADLGGLTIAYAAYQRSLHGKEPAPIDGFTGPQRFFLAWAQIWRGKYRPEYAQLLARTDPHAPPKYRANGPLSNMPEFAKAFGCKAGDPMVRPDSVRAQVW